MEKKKQEQSGWILSDRSYCNLSHRADKRREYATSVRLQYDASIVIHPLLAGTDSGTTGSEQMRMGNNLAEKQPRNNPSTSFFLI